MTATTPTYGENTRRMFLAVEADPSDTLARYVLADAVEEDTGDEWLGSAVRATADRWPRKFSNTNPPDGVSWCAADFAITHYSHYLGGKLFAALTDGIPLDEGEDYRDYPTPFAALCDLWEAWAETRREKDQ